MKKIISVTVMSLLLAAVGAYGGIPAINVIVSDAGSKLAYKGKTGANGTFATGNLAAGKYTVQFRTDGSLPGNYALVVSAGKQKVVAEAVAGSKFSQGGVALRLDVGKGLNITGQVSTGKEASANTSSNANAKVKIVNGKRYIWKGPETGSNFSGHWEEEGRASANRVESVDGASVIDTGARH